MSLSSDEVLAILDAEFSEALTSDNASQLKSDRLKNLSYYEGDMTDVLPNPIDRSKAVSTDVADVVDGLMPSLMDVFCGGDDICVFNPQGEDDVEGAEQETDYCNHIVMQQNNGFLNIHDFFKDGLISKVGVMKGWWEDIEDETTETYRGLDDDALAMLMADDDIEIIDQTDYELGHEPDEVAEGAI